jgi:hypothetical protein
MREKRKYRYTVSENFEKTNMKLLSRKHRLGNRTVEKVVLSPSHSKADAAESSSRWSASLRRERLHLLTHG